jgi:hypothetical protein
VEHGLLEKLTVPLIPVPLGVSVVAPVKLSPGEADDVSVNCHGPFTVFGDELPHANIKASAITSPRHSAYLILSPFIFWFPARPYPMTRVRVAPRLHGPFR